MTPLVVEDRLCTPVAEWPPVDRLAWERAQEPSTPFEPDSGRATRWRPVTAHANEQGYGRWIGWLAKTGRLRADSLPVERATFPAVSAYLEALAGDGLALHTQATRLQQLGEVLRAIAPAADWRWILRGANRIHSEANAVQDIDPRLRSGEEVLTLGLDLMRAAEHDRFRTDHDRGKLYRDGLMIALLSLRPIRLRNLSITHIDRQLVRAGEGWRLAFTAAEMKQKRPVEYAWPTELVEPLERYIEVFREGLLDHAVEPDGPRPLWVSRRAQAMTPSALQYQIKFRTEAEFGRSINPHRFRRIASTTIATAAPENATDAARLLGHSDLRMTEKYYNRATTLEAGRTYQKSILARRRAKAVVNQPLPLLDAISEGNGHAEP